jgi:hypothetical protein
MKVASALINIQINLKVSVKCTLTLIIFCLFVENYNMILIHTIHYTNSISEFYEDEKYIKELKYLPNGRIKEYNVKDTDIRLKIILKENKEIV